MIYQNEGPIKIIAFQPREVFVIGESYKPNLEQVSGRTNAVIGQAYPKEQSEPSARNVVVIGSRYKPAQFPTLKIALKILFYRPSPQS